MHIESRLPRNAASGYALMLTLAFIAISLLVLAGIGRWSTTATAINARNNAYNQTVAAAEAATEVVIARMDRDFLHQSLPSDPAVYTALVPGSFIQKGWPQDYRFSDGHGNRDRTDVICTGWQQWTNVDGKSGGLYGLINSYRITSNARQAGGLHPVAAGVRQSIQLTSIPLFQFAIFYSMDLEINPGAPMVVTGKTHSNGDIYVAPGSKLEFADTVSAAGGIYNHRNTNDPTLGTPTVPIYDAAHLERADTLTLPVGNDSNPTNVAQILDPPPFGEDPSSGVGPERFYNKCDLLVTTTDSKVTVQYNNTADGTTFTLVPTNSTGGTGYSFVNTNASFYDYREGQPVLCTQIDVQALTNWLAAGGASLSLLTQARTGHQINSIYIDDQRQVTGKLTAVRMVNGQYMPAAGLTVATADPLYVLGNYNAPDLTVGSTNTSSTRPAALVGDAITLLSPSWKDTWGTSTPLSSRNAANATVNAAFLAGIEPSVTVNGQKHYSGGVENYPRFLEDWSRSTLTYNGSMVVMFPSRYATNFWIAPGTYYNPPTRMWAFDQNFLDVSKLPPVTPQVKKLQRSAWTVVAATN